MNRFLILAAYLLATFVGTRAQRGWYNLELTNGSTLGDNNRPQRFMFDTGVSQFWTVSNRCRQPEWLQHSTYDYRNSSTYFSEGLRTTINYGDLGVVEGIQAQDTFHIAGATIRNQTFVEALNLPEPEVLPPGVDGVIGMDLCTFHDDAPYKNPLKLMEEQGLVEERMFTLFLYTPRDGISYDGHIRFGRPNDYRSTWQSRFVPVTHPDRWQFRMSKVSTQNWDDYQDRVSVCTGGCQAVINTGMQVILGPDEEVRRLNEDIGARQLADGSYLMPSCMPNSLPTLAFETDAGSLFVHPDYYIIKVDQDRCLSALFGGSESFWVLGHKVISSNNVVFDYGNKRIGFGLTAHYY